MLGMSISVASRRAHAEALGLSEQYLYQCLTGRKSMRPEEAVRVEHETGGALRRWHVRQADWHLIWPELVGAEGAPAVPKPTPATHEAA